MALDDSRLKLHGRLRKDWAHVLRPVSKPILQCLRRASMLTGSNPPTTSIPKFQMLDFVAEAPPATTRHQLASMSQSDGCSSVA